MAKHDIDEEMEYVEIRDAQGNMVSADATAAPAPMPETPRCDVRDCIHLIGAKMATDGSWRYVCRAFPEGIPNEIAYGEDLHLEPFPGDHGIQYESSPAP